MVQLDNDTISAIATAAGRGGIGIVRLSGPKVSEIAKHICSKSLQAKTAVYCDFNNADGAIIDQGVAILFPGPNSFTGEDVLELQGHGGTHVLNALLRESINQGARLARPGEFTERAFLNDKMDLLQAEAIADLIDASSAQAARSAMQTLQGVFSAAVNQLVAELIAIRVNVEAAIDFTDEDIDVMQDQGVASALKACQKSLQDIFKKARQGALLQEGLSVVLAGAPNVGKSSLLNALAGKESAIVTDIPGTTRDLLKEQLQIDGLPIHVTDTAGLRDSDDVVEKEGVRRARDAIAKADLILLLVDSSHSDTEQSNALRENLMRLLDDHESTEEISQLMHRLCIINNKADLVDGLSPGQSSTRYQEHTLPAFNISAKYTLGLDELRRFLLESSGYESSQENAFIARERHLIALNEASSHINSAVCGVSEHSPLELVAEDLRLAQTALGSITGNVSSDDLLGEIFSSFCIGK